MRSLGADAERRRRGDDGESLDRTQYQSDHRPHDFLRRRLGAKVRSRLRQPSDSSGHAALSENRRWCPETHMAARRRLRQRSVPAHVIRPSPTWHQQRRREFKIPRRVAEHSPAAPGRSDAAADNGRQLSGGRRRRFELRFLRAPGRTCLASRRRARRLLALGGPFDQFVHSRKRPR